MYASPKRSALVSGVLHAAAIVLVLAATKVAPQMAPRLNMVAIADRDLSPYVPVYRNTGGGGGGGSELSRASKGDLPVRTLRQFVPPTTHILNDNPRLAMEGSILGPPEITMPTPAVIGLPDGVIGIPSNGLGKGGGIGDEGKGGGVGNKQGPGAGDGDNGVGITGMAPMRGAVTPAVLQWKAEPDYSEDARRAKLQGTVVLHIVIDARGQATSIRVVRSLGLGLDEKAVEAVAKWRFRPAQQNGRPVPQPAIVDVSFRLL
jgi:TonB family protein